MAQRHINLLGGLAFFLCAVFVASQELRTSDTKAADRVSTPERRFVITDHLTPVVKPTNIMERIRVKFDESKNISAGDLADFANRILKKDGYDFTFDWTPKGKKNETNLAKAGEDYYPFYHSMVDEEGKRRSFQFMNDDFSHPCFSTIDIPVTKVNGNQIDIVSNGRSTELIRPKDFVTEEMKLVSKDLKRSLRIWKTPIDAEPVGISVDGTKIYFDNWLFYQDPGINYTEKPLGLAIEMSLDGTLKFVDIKDIPSGDAIEIDHDKKFTEISYKKYKAKGKEHIVKYSAPCT